jgi:ABC-type arginine/histidine transport system permease subunit
VAEPLATAALADPGALTQLLQVLPAWLPAFGAGLVVNVGIAAASLALGLAAGVPLTLARAAPGWAGRGAQALLVPLRAAPTFVVMFFVLHGLPWALEPRWAVTLALAVYATAYVSDTAQVAWQQWREGDRGAALLWPLALLRGFYVMVLSSGFGAAVGVVEATTVTLRALESLHATGARLALMALAVALFVVLFQALYALTDRLRRRLQAPAH